MKFTYTIDVEITERTGPNCLKNVYAKEYLEFVLKKAIDSAQTYFQYHTERCEITIDPVLTNI